MTAVNPDDILSLINQVKSQFCAWKNKTDYHDFSEKEFREVMESKFPDFSKSKKILFEKCINGDFTQPQEMSKLMYMLDKMKAIQAQETNFEDASKEVGQKFADEYVQPLVDKLDAKKEAKKAKRDAKGPNKKKKALKQ